MLEIFEKVKRRTVIVVEITKYGEHINANDVLMNDYDWQKYLWKLSVKEKSYRYINSDCIMFINRKEEKEES